jgi:hypothetical protein
MELKEALKVLEGYVFFDDSGEAIKTISATASLVEAMRGKIPNEKEENYHPSGRQYGTCEEYICNDYGKGYNQAIDDCAAAYIANMPTVEEIESELFQAWQKCPIKDGDSYDLGVARSMAKAVHALLVSKIGG